MYLLVLGGERQAATGNMQASCDKEPNCSLVVVMFIA